MIPYLARAEQVQVVSHTLTCRVEQGGPVLVSFFDNPGLGEAAPREVAEGSKVHVASLPDIAGTKAAVVQQRAQPRDYLDIDALIGHGIDLPRVLAAGAVVYGHSFNPLVMLKALSYFDDVPALPVEVQDRLRAAVEAVDPTRPPGLTPHLPARGRQSGCAMKALPKTPELLQVARRVIWFEEPEQALANPLQFLAHVMVFSTPEDQRALRGSSARTTIAGCCNTPRRAFLTRDRGRTGIWFVAADLHRRCRYGLWMIDPSGALVVGRG